MGLARAQHRGPSRPGRVFIFIDPHPWEQAVKPRDLSHIERNLDTLLQALAARCQEVFMEACKAAARSCVPLAGGRAAGGAGGGAAAAAGPAPLIRERTVPDESKAGGFVASRPCTTHTG